MFQAEVEVTWTSMTPMTVGRQTLRTNALPTSVSGPTSEAAAAATGRRQLVQHTDFIDQRHLNPPPIHSFTMYPPLLSVTTSTFMRSSFSKALSNTSGNLK